MIKLVSHPEWCRRVDCGSTAAHRSATIRVSGPGDLLGIDAMLMQLDVPSAPRLVRLEVTDDGATTTYLMPEDQARSLHRALGDLVAS